MFDGNERLVVCNQRCMDMYKMSGDVVKPSITLQNLLKYRISNGSFAHDPVAYRRDLVGAISAGKTTGTEVKCADGRSITVAQTRESAENVLSASQTVEADDAKLRREVEGFLSRVAA